ncbi:MAG: sel1 repeat family protein [Alphaproteobacteria bacterium]|nr:sel1 repeat family protein [Alphaproteobacteria bacterium]
MSQSQRILSLLLFFCVSFFVGNADKAFAIDFHQKVNEIKGQKEVDMGRLNKEALQKKRAELKAQDVILKFIPKERYLYLGDIYENIVKNRVEAFRYYFEAGVNGDAKAAFRLAEIYDSLKDKDNPRIVYWLKKSAEKGNVDAAFALGKIYHFGRKGVPQNTREALSWYKKAAEKGDKEALRNIEVLNHSEPMVNKTYGNDRWNFEWSKKFALSGDAGSQYVLAKAYEQGKFIPQNLTEAKKWYELSAGKGYVEAQCALAKMYEQGRPPQYKKAFDWYKKAAEKDYGQAQSKLAEMLLLGRGTKVDVKEAYKWFYLFVTGMFPHTKDLYKASPRLKEIADLLSPKTREEIHLNVRPFMKKNRPFVR